MTQKIDYKYCPQCRRALTIRAGNPHCAACKITIYVNDVVAAGCVLPIRDGKVLLARRAREPYKGTLDLIGGFMQPGETPEQSAIREAKEETGLDVTIRELLGAYPDRYGDGEPVLGIDYIGELADGPVRPHDDVSAVEWLPIAELDPDALEIGFPSVRDSLRDLQEWYRSKAGTEQ